MLQNQLLQERQQFEAWKARHAQPQVSQMQAPPIVPLGHTVSEKVKIDDDVEVSSVRSARTTLEGLAQSRGHLRLVLNVLRTALKCQ